MHQTPRRSVRPLHYINGPYEGPQRVVATLGRAVGRGGFHYTVSLGEADDLGDGYRYSAVLTDRNDDLSDAASRLATGTRARA